MNHSDVGHFVTNENTISKPTLNKIINAPCGTLKLWLALGVAKYIKSYKINFVVQYATDYCPLEHDNYKTISAHLGSPISCYINNLHGAFIFLLSINHSWNFLNSLLNIQSLQFIFGAHGLIKNNNHLLPSQVHIYTSGWKEAIIVSLKGQYRHDQQGMESEC